MIWGDQWVCGCGTHNLILRRKCRDCGLPQELKLANEALGEMMTAIQSRENPPGFKKEQQS